jgi:hypothetical protein
MENEYDVVDTNECTGPDAGAFADIGHQQAAMMHTDEEVHVSENIGLGVHPIANIVHQQNEITFSVHVDAIQETALELQVLAAEQGAQSGNIMYKTISDGLAQTIRGIADLARILPLDRMTEVEKESAAMALRDCAVGISDTFNAIDTLKIESSGCFPKSRLLLPVEDCRKALEEGVCSGGVPLKRGYVKNVLLNVASDIGRIARSVGATVRGSMAMTLLLLAALGVISAILAILDLPGAMAITTLTTALAVLIGLLSRL